jgi:general L-amino acid transport system permease protein
MALMTNPPREPFHLGMLLYDRRYRSTTIQAFTLLMILLALSWMTKNAVDNLEALGKPFTFSFLWVQAGYDIEPQLIYYSSSESTHFTAGMVGLLNTLSVAIPGCILATILGVIVGVLRLSKSWVTARLMTIYIETLRNVPVVLWLIALLAILSNVLPEPSKFRGEDADASMLLNAFAITNRGTYMPAAIWGEGSQWLMLVLILSIGGMWGFARYARGIQDTTGRRLPVFWINLLILILPVTLAYFLLGRPAALDYPVLTGFNFKGGMRVPNEYLALMVGLAVYTSSYIAENVRAGILAISKGQSEASYALGLRPGRTTQLVVLPQALRVIIPPLISQWLNLTKNTSLAYFVGFMDLRATLGGITMNQTGRELECNFLMMGIYLTLSLLISLGLNLYNRSIQLRER